MELRAAKRSDLLPALQRQLFARGLTWAASVSAESVLQELHATAQGLESGEARLRLERYGPNQAVAEERRGVLARLGAELKDPLSLLLLVLGLVSYLTGDMRATVLIAAMLLMSVGLRFVQELKADRAAEQLKAMVHTTATVLRGGAKREVPIHLVVPGDVVQLAAGDMVPADVRLIESKDLFLNQSALTGESLPVEKHAPPVTPREGQGELELPNLCFMGTGVETGTATAVAIATGAATRFGALASTLTAQREVSGFDLGIKRFTWLMIRFIGVMVPLVFLVNGFSKGDWLQAFLFALAVAVGLTPELLPMIVTVNLSKGAFAMSRRKVIVKRLNAIQNFGAMDILCTDKTGTLTEGRVALVRYVDLDGQADEQILDYAYLNSANQTSLKNMLDEAVLMRASGRAAKFERYRKVDEVPFDFIRRRMSVVVEQGPKGKHLLVCKGAVEEVLRQTSQVSLAGRLLPLAAFHRQQHGDLVDRLSREGFRLIALAYRELPPIAQTYTAADERDLTLLGFLAFLDPAKPSAGEAIRELERFGVTTKILTGDNELVTQKICHDVGLPVHRILKGEEVERMNDAQLAVAAEQANVFDKLEPHHKERIIRALQSRGHVVGFLGDGINDAPALRAADVGISVDTAADIAKEAGDIILLEKSLLVLQEGVREGRRVFGNIVKYIKMTASSNFGNMFSVVGASAFLPFLPVLPLQVIANNMLYDLSQVTIPTDSVDEEYLVRPRQWRINELQRFILVMGPVSSLFDYLTFAVLIWFFGALGNQSLFHTGWFVESLLTQTLVIHVLRSNKLPFIGSRASLPVTLTTLAVMAFGAWLPFSPFAGALGFVPLPPGFWLLLVGILVAYVALAQVVKVWFARRYPGV